MTLSADRIIVSMNEHWLYEDFWPLVAYAYRTIWPGIRVTLVFLSERTESDPFVAQLRRHGDVVLVRPVHNIPQAAQAKMARYFVAAQAGGYVCMIDDIDEIPIDRDWHEAKLAQRAKGSLLLVGAEVYGKGQDQCPASMMTAEGHVFRALFNPDNLPFDVWIHDMRRTGRRHADLYSRAHHEGMSCSTSQEQLGTPLFSDEALIAELRRERPVPVTHVERGYTAGVDTIDRSWWGAMDVAKLQAGGYLAAHTGRPYGAYREGNDAIMAYLQRRYDGGGPLPTGLHKAPAVDPDMRFPTEFGMTREAYQQIVATVPKGRMIVEYGSSHVSTNYLSRYWWVVSIESRRDMLNIYPSHYIYAPTEFGSYDRTAIAEGMEHPRIREMGEPALTVAW